MTKDLVSIIIPLYNSESYLERLADSLKAQTYENFEAIFVDDGSTDGSYDLLKRIAKTDDRFKVIRQENTGQSGARNTGIKNANGEFISFVDSDDEVAPDFIFELVKGILDSDLSVVGMHYKRLRQHTEKDVYIKPLRAKHKKESVTSYMLYLLTIDGRMYSSVNKLFRAEIIKNHNLQFPEGLKFGEDTRFVLNYIKHTDGNFCFVPKPLYIYNFGSENSTVNETGVEWDNWQKLYEDVKKWSGKGIKNSILLKGLLLRWKISYRRTIKRAAN